MRIFLTTLVLIATTSLAALAQDGKAELLDAWRADGFLGGRSASLSDALVDFKFTPAWYAKFTSESDPRNTLHNLVSALYDVGYHLNIGKVDETDTDRDQKSPLYTGMLDEWKSKMHMTIIIDQDLDAKGMQKVVDHMSYVIAPIQSFAKPRSGKYFLTIKFDPKAKAIAYKTDKAHVNFNMTVPVYADVSQSTLDDLVRRNN